ncbi:MAG: hypothetical protein P4L98_18365 [Ancalomicrobiaceae bacterium]|nr:hypothetical protein [Ancalomicrobiaceae bacterium]
MIPLTVLALALDVLCCVHVVRSGRDMYWLYLIIILQPIGAIVYLFAIIIPELVSGRGSLLGRKAMKIIDPRRAYREAQAEVEASPSVYNRMKLAEAAVELGNYDEAAHTYALCLDGIHSDDPVLMLRYAECLVELARFAEAIDMLDKLGDLGDPGRTPQAALLIARANDGLGNREAAERAYAYAAERVVGIEGLARYVAFLVREGRRTEAEDCMTALEKRFQRVPRAFRREAAKWRDLAAAALKAEPGNQAEAEVRRA